MENQITNLKSYTRKKTYERNMTNGKENIEPVLYNNFEFRGE